MGLVYVKNADIIVSLLNSMGLTLALQAPASSHFEGPATRIFGMSASQFTVLVYRLNDSSVAFDCQFKPRLHRHLTGKGER